MRDEDYDAAKVGSLILLSEVYLTFSMSIGTM